MRHGSSPAREALASRGTSGLLRGQPSQIDLGWTRTSTWTLTQREASPSRELRPKKERGAQKRGCSQVAVKETGGGGFLQDFSSADKGKVVDLPADRIDFKRES